MANFLGIGREGDQDKRRWQKEKSKEVRVMKKKVLVFDPGCSETYRELLERHIPEAEFLICDNRDELERYAPETEIAFVSRDCPQEVFDRMPKLEWVQILAAGVEPFVQNAKRFKGIPVSRVVGAFGKYMAEYVFAYLLYFSQNIARVLGAQAERKWDPFPTEHIHKRTMGIMGLGAVGTFLAQKAKGMGMKVVGWDLVPKDVSFADHQYEVERIHDFLQAADYVVVTLPATPQTANVINRDFLRAMKKTAYLINISRGALLDEKALVEALKGNEIAGAVLDVVKEEPLSPDSQLWDCPNLIISPHISGPSLPEDMVEVCKENFSRYVKKQPLLGLVDFERGF